MSENEHTSLDAAENENSVIEVTENETSIIEAAENETSIIDAAKTNFRHSCGRIVYSSRLRTSKIANFK